MERSPELVEAAGRLYSVPPAEFVAARDEEVRRARADGKPELARAVGQLRRPTQSAWLVNLLSRERADEVGELLDLGEDFRAAYADGAGERLRELSVRRQTLMNVLVRAAQRLGQKAGVRVSADASRDVEGTFGAALVDPDVAEQVRLGQLATPAEYAGFGPAWPTTGLRAAPGGAGKAGTAKAGTGRADTGKAGKTKAGAGKGGAAEESTSGRSKGDDRESREAEAQRARAESRLEAAREKLVDAERDLAEREDSLDSATRQRDKAREQLERLRAQVHDTEERLTALDRGVKVASKRVQRASDMCESAQRAVDEAARRLS